MSGTQRRDGGVGRRDLLKNALALGALAWLKPASLFGAVDRVANAEGTPVLAFPQKRPLLVHTVRPPQLETPFSMFDAGVFTPNDAFFVRWHLAGIPTSIEAASFRLTVHGAVTRPLVLSLEELRSSFEPVEVVAVCQCSGNSRREFRPRVPGVQWGHGAMGNARWTGVRLRDILERAGLHRDTVQIRFDGLDRPVLVGTPDFRKALNVEDALHESVLVAYAMNGEPLPWLNGYPLRLIVPGWYATYWVKMLQDIEVLTSGDRGYWTAKAYRIPADPCGCALPGQDVGETVPLGRMPVRSFITNLEDGATVQARGVVQVRGIAFDQGHGIDRVLLSTDGGESWIPTTLGTDHGPYSFRQWEASFPAEAGRTYTLQSRAWNLVGDTQRLSPRWNASGYLRNVVETVHVRAT